MSDTTNKREILKDYFNVGEAPSQTEFHEFIDSIIVQKDDKLTPKDGMLESGQPLAITENDKQELLIFNRAAENSWSFNRDGNKLKISKENDSEAKSNHLVIEDNGNIGLGANSPNANLHIQSNSDEDGNLCLESNKTSNIVFKNGDNKAKIAFDASEDINALTIENENIKLKTDQLVIENNTEAPSKVTTAFDGEGAFEIRNGDTGTKISLSANVENGVGINTPLKIHSDDSDRLTLFSDGQPKIQFTDINDKSVVVSSSKNEIAFQSLIDGNEKKTIINSLTPGIQFYESKVAKANISYENEKLSISNISEEKEIVLDGNVVIDNSSNENHIELNLQNNPTISLLQSNRGINLVNSMGNTLEINNSLLDTANNSTVLKIKTVLIDEVSQKIESTNSVIVDTKNLSITFNELNETNIDSSLAGIHAANGNLVISSKNSMRFDNTAYFDKAINYHKGRVHPNLLLLKKDNDDDLEITTNIKKFQNLHYEISIEGHLANIEVDDGIADNPAEPPIIKPDTTYQPIKFNIYGHSGNNIKTEIQKLDEQGNPIIDEETGNPVMVEVIGKYIDSSISMYDQINKETTEYIVTEEYSTEDSQFLTLKIAGLKTNSFLSFSATLSKELDLTMQLPEPTTETSTTPASQDPLAEQDKEQPAGN